MPNQELITKALAWSVGDEEPADTAELISDLTDALAYAEQELTYWANR